MKNLFISKQWARTEEIKDPNIDCDGTIRFWISSPFNLEDKESTNCFSLQIRTHGTTSLTGKTKHKMFSIASVSIDDLRQLLDHAEIELAQHRENIKSTA